MAVGLPPLSPLPPVPGFQTASTACGIKKNGATDLLLVSMAPRTAVAGLFTQNQIVAAPVTLCRQRLAGGEARALIVNSGNANVANGPQGMVDAQTMSQSVAQALNIPVETVFTASTGVIGELLPVKQPLAALPKLASQLKESGWKEAAEAIMTTDTCPKAISRQVEIEGKTVTLVGLAKGAGMIHPNMATMLSFLFTDAALSSPALQTLLERSVEKSFNSVTVDGDTSTNDTLMAFASGLAGHTLIEDPDDPALASFAQALKEICQLLAQWLIRDGEGASKFVTITVEGAENEADAKQVAMTVAKSPLVKTALAGCDPNWGRILCAVGYAGVTFPVDQIDLFLGEISVVRGGVRNPAYEESQGQEVMNREEISLRIDLKSGSASWRVWTSDLTHDYISINADYRS
ncbi:MAG: bifunctional glutamate N-acetyltransferase/amino-acid acetyltransferase ArgJ [Magnetococcales bacterium]|nr:bifunctional glutamate N-acetyltransferase/amino-acid acetyltransferase ArgJ [Magnetococcales bacterium]